MEDKKFEKLCHELTEKFKNSIPKEEVGLVEQFELFLKSSINEFKNIEYPFLKTDDKWILKQIKMMAENVISKSLEEKKKIFIIDKSYKKIVDISNQTYDIASNILRKKNVNIDFNISEKVEELENLLKTVEPYNKENAEKLISETIADLHFIEHPDTKAYSFRLRDLKKFEEEER